MVCLIISKLLLLTFAAYCTYELSELMYVSLAAELHNFLVATSSISVCSCSFLSGLTAAQLTVFDSALNPKPSSSASRCFVTHFGLQPFLWSTSKLPNISILRTSRFPRPRMPRNLAILHGRYCEQANKTTEHFFFFKCPFPVWMIQVDYQFQTCPPGQNLFLSQTIFSLSIQASDGFLWATIHSPWGALWAPLSRS